MPGNEPTSSEPNMCQSTEPSIQCPIHVPRAPTVFTKIETGIDETPRYPQVRRQLVCQPHTEQRTEQDDGPTRLNVCPHRRCTRLGPLDQRIGCFGADFRAARYCHADIALLEGGRDTDGWHARGADCCFGASVTHERHHMSAVVQAKGKRDDGWPITTSPRANQGNNRMATCYAGFGHSG